MQKKPTSFREHPELGQIEWLRDLDHGLLLAARENKPVLLLFQEVPGCSTCVDFGQDVLAHPLMTEVIAGQFVPVAIFNNRPGSDADVLQRYGERPWNNPVVRFLAADGEDLLPKLANRYDAGAMFEKIAAVLEMTGQEVPGYFRLLGRDLLIEQGMSETVTYTTPCFWSGETSLAQHPAVITTDAGWIDGEEVVRTSFDPGTAARSELDDYARAEGFLPLACGHFKIDDEPQFYLRKHPARYLPLTPAQRTQINLALPYRASIVDLLSPQQRVWLTAPHLQRPAWGETYRADIRQSWPLVAARFEMAADKYREEKEG